VMGWIEWKKKMAAMEHPPASIKHNLVTRD